MLISSNILTTQMKTPNITILTSLHVLTMEHQQLSSAFLLLLLSAMCASHPCGTRQVCECFRGGINIVSCANQDLDYIPGVEKIYKTTAEKLILDGNQITSMTTLDLNEWPSLLQVYVRNNPGICKYLKNFAKQTVVCGIKLINDCTDPYQRELTVVPIIKKYETTTEEDTQITVQAPKAPHALPVGAIIPKYEPTNAQERSATAQPNPAHASEIVTTGQPLEEVENTTSARIAPSIQVTFDWSGISLKIVVPIACFGIASLIITLIWRRRNPKKLDMDLALTREKRMKRKNKYKTSPTPSETSEIVFHMMDRRSTHSFDGE